MYTKAWSGINIELKNWSCHVVKKDKGNYLYFFFYADGKGERDIYEEGKLGTRARWKVLNRYARLKQNSGGRNQDIVKLF